MANSAALNEVVRVLGTELGKNDERVLIGSTPEEKHVLEKHASIGKKRAVMGFTGGAVALGGAWKAIGGQRRLLGALTMSSGGMAGFMYGILSIRRDLFVDILTLPDDKSPFAQRSRQILDELLPTNPFYMEVKAQFEKHAFDNGSWDSTPSFPKLDAVKPHDSDNDLSGHRFGVQSASLPPLPRLTRIDENSGYSDDDSPTSERESQSSSPFFFGRPSPSAESDSDRAPPPPPPRDFYGDRRAPPQQRKGASNDDYDPWDDDRDHHAEAPKKATTWEELRRRAASSK